ncbi:hypothetical protein CJ030_MR2G019404 [Morella rubra]|uniref:Uncharacterized protein n=1 Tax=Morella rubra TaxID=262757 RepID=A0A6A1WKL5_9ROSI|nr:hypothetical protein CJ030_MR2G019404 [Morella rubra]
MSCSVVVELHIQLANFFEFRFEDRTLPEIVEQAGWLSFLQRTGYASKNLCESSTLYTSSEDLEEPSMEVTVWNVKIIFSPDELALFLGYVRDVTAFPNVPMTEEGWPTKAEVFRTLLGPIRLSWREATCFTGTASVLEDHAPDSMLHHRPEEAHDGGDLWPGRVLVHGSCTGASC